ncbi:hypothetical protein N0V95_002325 [Ascochyta clinopodiicola]|nr:hypothetical protein N0V95_002325 [Ascochyta clinopodiicola]
MDTQSSSLSGIGKALQQQDGKREVNTIIHAGKTKRMLLPGNSDQPMSEAHMFPYLDLGLNGAAETTLDSSVKGIGVPQRRGTVPTFNNDLRDFCTGQPPEKSYLAPGGRTSPRFRMSRRSTLADKPELDSLLIASMITLATSFMREIDTLESGSDWERILQCFPNLQTVIFEHPVEEPTNLTRDTFYALKCALANSTTLQKTEKVQLHVPPRVLFGYHRDYHHDQRQSRGPLPHASSATNSPLTMVGSDMVYADGVEAFGLLNDDAVFGKVGNH